MSLPNPENNEEFMIRIHKRLTSSPLLSWVNTYEFVAEDNTTLDELKRCALYLRQMERAIHLSDASFFKTVISTWVPDGTPYNPTSFVTISHSGEVGDRAAADPRDLDTVLQVNRVVPTGREGKIFYRRVLAESEVAAPAGQLALLPTPQDALQDIITAELAGPLGDFVGTAVGGFGKLAMISPDQDYRVIFNLVASAAKVVKYNHRYYNRL